MAKSETELHVKVIPDLSEVHKAMHTPAVGRIVHYVSFGTPGGEYQSECRAAIITAVDEYQKPENQEFVGHVDLCVLNPTGLFFNRGVHHAYADIETGTHRGGTWHWPERV